MVTFSLTLLRFLFQTCLLLSLLLFSSLLFSFLQSQEFSMTQGWTRKLLPWSSTHQELIKNKSGEKQRESVFVCVCVSFSHIRLHCKCMAYCTLQTEKENVLELETKVFVLHKREDKQLESTSATWETNFVFLPSVSLEDESCCFVSIASYTIFQ